MDEDAWLAQRFEEHRGRLKAIVSRMLGSSADADDVVQEAWLRFARADTSSVENLGSWLTTVVSRLCLNILQARRSRPEAPAAADLSEPSASTGSAPDPEQELLLADSIGLALSVVLDTLTPAERVALVLHDVFGILRGDRHHRRAQRPCGASAREPRPAARARTRRWPHCRSSPTSHPRRGLPAASRNGDFDSLLTLLDPDVVLRADEAAADMGVAAEARGPQAVATFSRRAGGARAALVDGEPGAVWLPGGRPRVVFFFSIAGERILGIDLVADPERLSQIDLVVTENQPIRRAGMHR